MTLPPELTPGHPLFGLGYAKPQLEREFVRLDEDGATKEHSSVAEEVPVALVYNQRPHVVMMATPADLEDFATGFTLSEEIVARASDIASVRVQPYSQGVEIQITIPASAAAALEQRGRQLVGQTGCGLCGVQTIADALRPTRAVTAKWTLHASAVWRAEGALAARQELNQSTGAVHAAAWATRERRTHCRARRRRPPQRARQGDRRPRARRHRRERGLPGAHESRELRIGSESQRRRRSHSRDGLATHGSRDQTGRGCRDHAHIVVARFQRERILAPRTRE